MTRERFHAIFLAAIMVLSVVAMGAGFAGSAAGQEAGQNGVVLLDASGDEVGNSFDSVQAAVNEANEGFTIVVGSGTYDGSVTVDVPSVTIRAGDDAQPEINGIVTVAASGVTIDGLTIDGGARDAAPLDVQAGDVTISNNTVTGGPDSGGISTWSGAGPVVGEVSIRDNTVEGGPIGLVVDSQSTDIDIRNNEIRGASSEGIWLSDFTSGASISEADITVRDNNISDVGLADVKIEQEAPGSLNGNEELVDPSAAAESFLADSSAETVRFWDGQVYNENGNAVVQEGDSIQAAIDAAEPGDTIAVADGTYDEQVTIGTDDLTLRAQDGTPELSSDGTVVQIRAANATISGFDITGDSTFSSGNLGIDIRGTPDSSSVSVSDTTFEDLYLGIQTGSGGSYSFTAEDVNVNNSVSGFGHQSTTGSAVIRDSDITVNTQGVGIYKANNAVVDNNTITVDAGSIDGQEAAFETERGVDFSGSNVTIRDNDISSTDTAILSENYEGVSVDDVTVAGNEIDGEEVAVSDQPENLDLNRVLGENTFDRAVTVRGDDGIQTRSIFGSIQNGVDAASQSQLVAVSDGVYDEDVRIETRNVSVVGTGDGTVIRGLVYLNAEESSLTNLAVEPDEFIRPTEGDGELPNNANQGILITASDTLVYDTSVNVSLDAAGAFEEVNAIQVFGGSEDISGVEVINNDISGFAGNHTVAGVAGVSDQGDTSRTIISNNSIDVHSEGYSFGVVTRASGGSNVEGTPETVVVYNDIDATADAYPGVGYGIESTDEAQVDADAQVVKDNTFGDVDSIQHKADNGTLDVTMNEWEDLENVSFITDGYPDARHNGGEIVYDPFLTSAPPSPDDFTRPGERTDFGHDLVVPADGEPHSVAFPAPVEGNVSEVFGEFDGTIYAYNGTEWKSGNKVRDEDIDALDAFVVTIDEDEEDLRIDFEYAETDSPVPSMTTAELEEGWNFVGAPTGDTDSEDAFAGSTGDITTVIDAIAGPESRTTPYGLDASGEVSNPSRVSPFKGYWVFVTDDGELGATVPVDPTQETEEGALTGR